MTEAPEVRWSCRAYVDERGMLLPDDPVRWRGALMRFRDKRVTVMVSREKQRRSLPQLRYLWGAVYPLLAEWSGYTKDELHEAMKWRHLKREVVLPTGELVQTVGSTTKLSLEQMGEFVDAVLRDAAEWGVYVPGPNDSVGVEV